MFTPSIRVCLRYSPIEPPKKLSPILNSCLLSSLQSGLECLLASCQIEFSDFLTGIYMQGVILGFCGIIEKKDRKI